jgi:hypothetical protein
MARMPPAPVAVSSLSEKPRTWSISSWLRMRSPPARSPESSPPSSIMVAHSAAMSLVVLVEACSARAAPHSSASELSLPSSAPAGLAPALGASAADQSLSSPCPSVGSATVASY